MINKNSLPKIRLAAKSIHNKKAIIFKIVKLFYTIASNLFTLSNIFPLFLYVYLCSGGR